jgi:methylase of polypeptide subunit release factors
MRACFAAAGYEDAAVCRRLGIDHVGAVEPLYVPHYLHQHLRESDAQAALIRLFLLQRPVPDAELRPAFGPGDVALLAALGLVEQRSEALLPLVDLYPFGGDWLATDRGDAAGEGASAGRVDAVMPLNMSTHLLAQLVLPTPAEAVLDIGTGCGVHAIRAARRARHVVATDLNPRALAFAAFNAALNGVENIEFREGSLWEPVNGECFDSILVNPAFTLSADTAFLFRDGGTRGDRMTAALLVGATAHLREGGVAQVIGEFPTMGESGFEEQVEGWIGEAPCDRLLLRFGAMEPLEYARAYAHRPFGQTQAAYEAALGARLADFAALGVRDVVLGAVLLRRRASGPHWTVRRVLPAPGGHVGSYLARFIAILDRCAAADSPRWLSEGVPRMVPGLRLTETRHWQPDGWEPAATTAGVADNPLCQEVRLSAPARDLLVLCDGARSGAEIAVEFARCYELEAAEAVEVTAAFLRELVEQGLIEGEERDTGGAVARGE